MTDEKLASVLLQTYFVIYLLIHTPFLVVSCIFRLFVTNQHSALGVFVWRMWLLC